MTVPTSGYVRCWVCGSISGPFGPKEGPARCLNGCGRPERLAPVEPEDAAKWQDDLSHASKGPDKS